MMLLEGQTTDFHMYEQLPFLPIAPYSTCFGFPDHSLILQATPFTDERLVRVIIHLQEQKVVKRDFLALFTAHLTRFSMHLQTHSVHAGHAWASAEQWH